MLGNALMWTIYGKVYNGITDENENTYGKVYRRITDDDTHDDILNLFIVHLLWCSGWWFVVSPHACFRALLVLPDARFPCCLAFVTRTKF